MTDINKLWIDCDPGIDDAISLIIAFKQEEFEVVGISSVKGNVSAEVGKNNIIEICELLDWEVPVYKGEEVTLSKEISINNKYLKSGLGYYINNNEYEEESIEASEAIYFAARETDKLDIICIGPTTNIAKAIINHPDIVDKIGDVFIMGGALNGGNITGNAEFNVYRDPKALNILLENNLQIFLFSLDLTTKFGFTEEEIKEITGEDTSCENLIIDMIDFLIDERSNKEEEVFIHDIFPIYGYIFKDGIIYEQIKLKVDETDENRGKLLVDETGSEVYYAVKLNEENLKQYIIETLNKK
ncbi:nucleoside hydrolase [Miniphocaeibacter massiliensis]|uniref:nucleoside hydrolase n=1 Tax=Miniphocaeibacter massiliensis TaxID=2041841 RepID=UPI000C1C3B65|nr:nucleoside hydrolase [Miniphocaeibacter massiliensis]